MDLGSFLWRVFLFNAMALGNGAVMFPLVQRGFVRERGGLSIDQLLFAFALAQATLGQGNLYMASIGYMLFGIPAAFLAILAINLPGYLMLWAVRWYDRLRDLRMVRCFMRGMTSASVGLIFAATVDMARHALIHPASWGVFLLTLALTQKLRWNSLASLLVATSAGMLIMPGGSI
jgi:chromate transporter